MTRAFQNTLLASVLALGLSGCIRPLYGSAEFGGLAVQQGLAGVSIEIQGDRLEHYIRSELEFNLRGDGVQTGPRTHRLVVNAKQRINTAIVDRVSGSAESANLIIDAKYALFELTKTTAVTEGNAMVAVTYDRSQQRFASARASRDAEIRGAKQLAEQIRIRVASHLAGNR
jgi:LPS-assembly lipoprotein